MANPEAGPAGYFAGLNDALTPAMTSGEPQEFEHTSPFEVVNNTPMADDSNKKMPENAAQVDGYSAYLADRYVASAELPREQAERSDYEILNERLDEVMRVLLWQNDVLVNTANGVGWLSQMLSGVAQVAQKMPGMGGMVARMMTRGGNSNG